MGGGCALGSRRGPVLPVALGAIDLVGVIPLRFPHPNGQKLTPIRKAAVPRARACRWNASPAANRGRAEKVHSRVSGLPRRIWYLPRMERGGDVLVAWAIGLSHDARPAPTPPA
jgi:hypothetical protein